MSYYALGALALPTTVRRRSTLASYHEGVGAGVGELAALDAEIGSLEAEMATVLMGADEAGAFWQSKEKRAERKRMRKKGYWKPVGASHYRKKPLLLRKPGKAVKRGWHSFWRKKAPSVWLALLKKERRAKVKARMRKKSRRADRQRQRMEEQGYTVTGVGAVTGKERDRLLGEYKHVGQRLFRLQHTMAPLLARRTQLREQLGFEKEEPYETPYEAPLSGRIVLGYI